MLTAVVNVKTNPQIKKQAQKIASELGFSLSALINGYLNQLVRTKTIHFSAAEVPSKWMIKNLKESGADIKSGRVSPKFDNAEDATAWLRNPKKKYANQI